MENNTMFKNIEGRLSDPKALSTEVVEVVINPTDILSEYALAIASQCYDKGNNLLFTQEELVNYFEFVIYDRICFLKGSKRLVKEKIDWRIPDFIYLLLTKIGPAMDDSVGIEFTPVLPEMVDEKGEQINLYEYFNAEKLKEVNRKIGVHSKLMPFTFETGIPNNRSGDLHLMLMNVVNSQVTSYNNSAHPSYALLAATLNQTYTQEIIKMRVDYGSVGTFKSLISELVS